MSLTITARSVITGALRSLGVADGSAPPTAEDMQTGYDALRELVDNWSLQSLTSLLQERTVFPLVASQQDYTIGPAALTPNISTGTAARPLELVAAGLMLGSTTPRLEIPMAVFTETQWQGLAIKTLSGIRPTVVSYTPTDPLGLITVWPVPSAISDVVLYTALLVPNFTSLSASYVCPPGYAKALRFNLAKVLVSDFAVPELVETRVTREADQSLADVKRNNVQIGDLEIDAALTGDGAGGYSIWSDG